MEKVFVVQKVANELHATEAAIDDAMMRATKLVNEIVAAHRELGISAVVVDDAIASATQAIHTLATARGAVVTAHHRLEEVRKRMGVRVKMTGWKPNNAIADHEPTQMQNVG